MNDKTGSIVNDDGKENAAAMRNNGKINFATFWKMELQFYGKMICNFLEKCLTKNTPRRCSRSNLSLFGSNYNLKMTHREHVKRTTGRRLDC